MDAGDFQLVAVRLAAFATNFGDFNPSAILAAVIGPFGKKFDGQMQVVPFPPGIPPELFRIQLASKDGQWGFGAAPAQFISSWNRNDRNAPNGELASLITECQGPLLRALEASGMRIARLGLLVSRRRFVERPADFLINRFCNDKVKNPDSVDAPLRHSTNFEIHNHKRYSFIPDLPVNSWVRCRTGLGEGLPEGFSVEQDINTLSEEMERRAFSPIDITEFYSKAGTETGDILRKYFP